jgi:dihydrodipicolinate synthase/N-acetylneuraminate lyase
VIERSERCAERGIELFQLSQPSWGALTDRELATFFAETCGRFPGLRFLHYNLPRARRVLTPDEYAVLAERHPNLAATKNAGADPPTLRALLDRAGALRHFVTEPGYAHGSLAGPCGLLISVAVIDPALAREYFEAGHRRDAAAVRELGEELSGIADALHDALGGDRIDGAYDKCFSRVHDPRFPLRLLPPYEGAGEDEYERFLAAVRERHPRWIEGRSR